MLIRGVEALLLLLLCLRQLLLIAVVKRHKTRTGAAMHKTRTGAAMGQAKGPPGPVSRIAVAAIRLREHLLGWGWLSLHPPELERGHRRPEPVRDVSSTVQSL